MQVAVIGQSSLRGFLSTTDAFFALLVADLCLNEYTFYGPECLWISSSEFPADSSVVVVGTENETMITITVPMDAHIKINTTDWFALTRGELFIQN